MAGRRGLIEVRGSPPPSSYKMNKPQKNQAGQEEGAGEGEGGFGFFPESAAEVADQGQAQS